MYPFSGIRQSVPYTSVADDDVSGAGLVEGQIVSDMHSMNLSGAGVAHAFVSAANIR